MNLRGSWQQLEDSRVMRAKQSEVALVERQNAL